MKKSKLLGIVFAAALVVVLAACVYEGPPANGGVDPDATEWVVGAPDGLTITVGTSRTYTNLATRAGADYAAARESGRTNVIMTFTFNPNGSLASYATVETGHGVDGTAGCTRWSADENAGGENVYFFLNRLIAEGVAFPVNVAEVNTTGRATYSRAAVLYAANFAAANR